MVTTLSSGRMFMFGAALVVAVLLAPALIYAHIWWQAAKRSRVQQARESGRGKLIAQSLPGRSPGPRTWPEGQARPSARATDSR